MWEETETSYEAKISRYDSCGPFAWYIEIHKGYWDVGAAFAVTRKRAEHKARRMVARRQRADERQKETYVVR